MRILALVFLFALPTFAQVKDPFALIFGLDTITEKKAVWSTLTRPEQIEVFRQNFAWGATHLDLDTEQLRFLARLSGRLGTATLPELNEFEAEAIELFPENGDVLFGSIGPYTPCSVFVEKMPITLNLQNDCPCSVGSSFNMQCDGECTTAGGRCTVKGSGCGFAWMYSCNGFCLVN